jgi:cutinase
MPSIIPLLTLALSICSTIAAPVLDIGEIEARQSSCPDVQVYFARGTTETPTLGTVVGPPFSAALSSQLSGKTLGFEGIAYPATVAGYLAGGDAGGATTMANAVTSKASSCPNTKIVISGYRLVAHSLCP